MTRRPSAHQSANLPPVLDTGNGLRQRQRADGSWRVWWEPSAALRRAGAQTVELDAGKPGHASRECKRLTDHWTRAARGDAKPRPSGRLVSDLIADYRASRWFTEKAASTKASYNTDLRAIETKWGTTPVGLIDAPMMDIWYEALLGAKGEYRARALLTMMSILMLHAERRGWRPKGGNPCADLRMHKPKGRRRVGTTAELVALLDAAATHPMLTLALRLAIYTGQRQTDLLQARPEDFTRADLDVAGHADKRTGYIWSLTRSKRGNAGLIPIIDPELVAALEAAITAAATGPGTLLWNPNTGEPYYKERFFEQWETARAAAAKDQPTVATLQWRDLRRTFANVLRANGVSKDDAGDLIGNTAATNAFLGAVYMAPQLATAMRAVATVTPMPKRKKA